ncbi:MAG: DUF4747 family protein [Bacteroidia bacterium]|nr:DUF4747 family protein [Bacteroidia bacterium]
MKEKEFQFYIINIPIKPNKEANAELYEKFFKSVFDRKKYMKIGKDKAAILRTYNKSDSNHGIIYGYFSTFTRIDGKHWINLDNMEKESHEIPKNKFPNLRESYYFFFPKIHRFVVMKTSSGVSLKSVLAYFHELKKDLKEPDFEVFYELSKNSFKEILSAEVVNSLCIEVSYSNAGIGNDAFKFVDKDMKDSNTQKIKIEAKAEKGNGINIKESKILEGSLKLAESYGNATASVTVNKRRRTIKTENYPFVLKIKSSLADFARFYNKLFSETNDYLKK